MPRLVRPLLIATAIGVAIYAIYQSDLLDGLGSISLPGAVPIYDDSIWVKPLSQVECEELVPETISFNDKVIRTEALEEPLDYPTPRILNLHEPRAIDLTDSQLTCEAEATLDTGKGHVRFWLAEDIDGSRHHSYIVTEEEPPLSEVECQELVPEIIRFNEDVHAVEYERSLILNLHEPRAVDLTDSQLTCEAEATLDTGEGRVRFWLAEDSDGERNYGYVVTETWE